MSKKSILTSLTQEELAKIPPVSDEEIQDILDKVSKERLAAKACTPSIVSSGLYFRNH